jgi:hypothetical protein
MPRMVRNLVSAAACGVVLTIAGTVPALALVNPSTGQHGSNAGNSCTPGGTAFPGNAANAAGSPFNSSGQAGNVYAGNQGTASTLHANSTAAVSQYDVACFALTGH